MAAAAATCSTTGTAEVYSNKLHLLRYSIFFVFFFLVVAFTFIYSKHKKM